VETTQRKPDEQRSCCQDNQVLEERLEAGRHDLELKISAQGSLLSGVGKIMVGLKALAFSNFMDA
jgi:hypothetical protein